MSVQRRLGDSALLVTSWAERSERVTGLRLTELPSRVVAGTSSATGWRASRSFLTLAEEEPACLACSAARELGAGQYPR